MLTSDYIGLEPDAAALEEESSEEEDPGDNLPLSVLRLGVGTQVEYRWDQAGERWPAGKVLFVGPGRYGNENVSARHMVVAFDPPEDPWLKPLEMKQGWWRIKGA